MEGTDLRDMWDAEFSSDDELWLAEDACDLFPPAVYPETAEPTADLYDEAWVVVDMPEYWDE